jgi:hypothetical protein
MNFFTTRGGGVWRAALLLLLVALLAALAVPGDLLAHGVTAGDKGYIQESSGTLPIPFMYLGAKHMVTGYDYQSRRLE